MNPQKKKKKAEDFDINRSLKQTKDAMNGGGDGPRDANEEVHEAITTARRPGGTTYAVVLFLIT
jgi:hypothetical protein